MQDRRYPTYALSYHAKQHDSSSSCTKTKKPQWIVILPCKKKKKKKILHCHRQALKNKRIITNSFRHVLHAVEECGLCTTATSIQQSTATQQTQLPCSSNSRGSLPGFNVDKVSNHVGLVLVHNLMLTGLLLGLKTPQQVLCNKDEYPMITFFIIIHLSFVGEGISGTELLLFSSISSLYAMKKNTRCSHFSSPLICWCMWLE